MCPKPSRPPTNQENAYMTDDHGKKKGSRSTRASIPPIALPNLTELFLDVQIEEYGQKRNCPP